MEHFDFGTKLKYLGIKSCIYCKIQKYVCIVLLDEFIKKNFCYILFKNAKAFNGREYLRVSIRRSLDIHLNLLFDKKIRV